jgi:hypothetical protein
VRWSLALNPKPVGYATELMAVIDLEYATGTVAFYEVRDGTRTLIATGPVQHSMYVSLVFATLPIPSDHPVGSTTFVAAYSGDETYAPSETEPYTLVVGPRPSTTILTLGAPHDATGATAQVGEVVTISALVADDGWTNYVVLPLLGTVTLKVDGITIATRGLSSLTELPTTGLALGVHTVRAEFISTNDVYQDSAAETEITIVPDTVEAHGTVITPTTFYPYRDGYKDTVRIAGERTEAASVAVRIYSSTGKLVRSVGIALAEGPYSTTWNGRNSAGTTLAAGKYTVKQTFTDAAGTTATDIGYVTLSAKRLYTYTKSLTKTKSQNSKRTSWWGAFQFTLPSATVYRKLTFKVYAKSGAGDGGFGPHDFTECGASAWMPDCVLKEGHIKKTYSWVTVGGSTTKNRSGRTVRLYVWANHSSVWLKYARVVVTYSVLK